MLFPESEQQPKKKKLVFFFEKKQAIGGGIIFYMNLARYIAQNNSYDVYYINVPNKKLEELYALENVHYINVYDCDYSQFEGADFIVPLNYIFLFLEKTRHIKCGRILLFNWHPYLFRYLSNQFVYWNRDNKAIFSLFRETHSIACMDKSCLMAMNSWSQDDEPLELSGYVPVFLSNEQKPYMPLPIIHEDRISIGWLGRLDPDKIFSLINLLDNLLLSDIEKPIDIHIIGDGSSRNKINISKYASRIRFIFTSYLMGEERDQYILNHIDLMVAMGISALDSCNLGIPTVLPLISLGPFIHNQFTFVFDTDGYSLGWDLKYAKDMDTTTYTIEEAIEMVYAENGKNSLGKQCYSFSFENFNESNSARLLLDALEQSSLTMEHCLENSVIRKQLKSFDFYKAIRRSYNRNYASFILFNQKLNRMKNRSMLGKLKVLSVIAYTPIKRKAINMKTGFKNRLKTKLRPFVRRYKYGKVQKAYHEKIKYLSEYAKQNQLKVAFLVMFSSVFPCEPILEQLLKESKFSPYVIVIPDMQKSLKNRIAIYKNTLKEMQEKYGERVISGYDYTCNEYYDPGAEYQIIFFNNPYSRLAHKYHHVTHFLNQNVLTLYVNYGFAAVKYGRIIIDTDFYNLLWKVCLDSQINFEDVKEHQIIKGKNALVTGYLKMDRLAKATISQSPRKKIIICPHHTVLGWKTLDISNFLTYSEFFQELPRLYPGVDFVFRPHPLLFTNLLEKGMWTQEEIDDYISRMEENPNIYYDNKGDYFDLFANSDAMIHDCSSFVGEYLFTEKPCCYMLKSEEQIDEVFLPMGHACLAHYYKAFSREDICRFIDDVVLNGNDPLKDGREEFSRTQLKFNYPHASNLLIKSIKDALKIQEEE